MLKGTGELVADAPDTDPDCSVAWGCAGKYSDDGDRDLSGDR